MTMRRLLFGILLSLLTVSRAFGQAAVPSIMVIPSDAWCNENGYMNVIENNGVRMYQTDYRGALIGSPDLKTVIAFVNNMMTEFGYRTVDLEATLKNIETENALNSVTMSSSGDGFAETPREMMSRVAKADLLLEVGWTMNVIGPKKSLTFSMRALDSYTQKEVASAIGTTSPSIAVELPVLLEEAVSSYSYDFSGQLRSFFDELLKYGREITLEIRVWENAGFNLESDMAEDMLGYMIEDWVYENAAGGARTPVTASENVLVFSGVRMPNVTPEGRQIDARYWTRPLVRMLRENWIDSKLYTKGLGHVMIVLGQK